MKGAVACSGRGEPDRADACFVLHPTAYRIRVLLKAVPDARLICDLLLATSVTGRAVVRLAR